MLILPHPADVTGLDPADTFEYRKCIKVESVREQYRAHLLARGLGGEAADAMTGYWLVPDGFAGDFAEAAATATHIGVFPAGVRPPSPRSTERAQPAPRAQYTPQRRARPAARPAAEPADAALERAAGLADQVGQLKRARGRAN